MMLRTRLSTRQLEVLRGQRQRHISPGEREAAYQAALRFVDWIEPDGYDFKLRGHWRNRAGKLLKTLDEVVRAYRENDLIM